MYPHLQIATMCDNVRNYVLVPHVLLTSPHKRVIPIETTYIKGNSQGTFEKVPDSKKHITISLNFFGPPENVSICNIMFPLQCIVKWTILGKPQKKWQNKWLNYILLKCTTNLWTVLKIWMESVPATKSCMFSLILSITMMWSPLAEGCLIIRWPPSNSSNKPTASPALVHLPETLIYWDGVTPPSNISNWM